MSFMYIYVENTFSLKIENKIKSAKNFSSKFFQVVSKIKKGTQTKINYGQ